MKQAKWFLLLHLILGIYATSSVCSKLAARQPFLSVAFIGLYGTMLLALGSVCLRLAAGHQTSAADHRLCQQGCDRGMGILLGFLIFGESVTPGRWWAPSSLSWASCCLCGPTMKGRMTNEPGTTALCAALSQ